MYQDANCEVPLTDKDLRCSLCLCPKLWTVAEKCCTELLHRIVVLSLDSRDDALCILDLQEQSAAAQRSEMLHCDRSSTDIRSVILHLDIRETLGYCAETVGGQTAIYQSSLSIHST